MKCMYQFYKRFAGKTMGKYKVLIIGSGGREHALGWKIKQSPFLEKLYFAPGNAGTAQLGENIKINADQIDQLMRFALKNKVDLTVVGPEGALAAGVVDLFLKNHLTIFGPTKKAAQLESSKMFAVNFMQKYHIPHPRSWIFHQSADALQFIKNHPSSTLVIKADGLAAGKGVFVCSSRQEAELAVREIMIDKTFAEAGDQVIIQERLIGQEVSVLAITDGKKLSVFPPAQDHKRALNNDRGANTGGMGAYAPVPFVDKELLNTIEKTILWPTIMGMRKDKIPYRGILYAGLMITKKGPIVLEFNARFGDPETQALMMILKSDLLPVLLNCSRGKLTDRPLDWREGFSLCVILSSKGYPSAYKKGEPIIIANHVLKKDITLFHAGTTLKGGQLVTNGGRVIGVTGFRKSMRQVIRAVYQFIKQKGVYFKGAHYRTDIGQKGIIGRQQKK